MLLGISDAIGVALVGVLMPVVQILSLIVKEVFDRKRSNLNARRTRNMVRKTADIQIKQLTETSDKMSDKIDVIHKTTNGLSAALGDSKMAQGLTEGMAAGLVKGIAQGTAEGMATGLQQGRDEVKQPAADLLVRDTSGHTIATISQPDETPIHPKEKP